MKNDFIGTAIISDIKISDKDHYLTLYSEEKKVGKIIVKITE